LAGSAGKAFIGAYVLGLGFLVDPAKAEELIGRDARNRKVLFPYMAGEDVNSSPDISASRWVINFHDWSEEQAKAYPECYDHLVSFVKNERLAKKDDTARRYWWRFLRRRPELNSAIAQLERVIVLARTSRTAMPVVVPTGQVMNENVVVIASDDTALLALLSGSAHYWWAVARGGTLKTDMQYRPSDVFETLPFPEMTSEMRELGDRLDHFRRDVMLARQAGLTKTYNLVHDPECSDADIVELREIHKAIDEAVCRAYGWDDLIPQLDHGYHPVGRETRYTVGPAVQRELVDRLLELNHERYAAEVAAGLHDKKGKKRPKAGEQDGLF
jgi:hypothetical protein